MLTAYAAQAASLALAPVLAAAGAFALSAAQRRLSIPARNLRRRAQRVEGAVTYGDGRTVPITVDALIRPLEGALRAASWATILLAAALAVARLGLLLCPRAALVQSRLSSYSELPQQETKVTFRQKGDSSELLSERAVGSP